MSYSRLGGSFHVVSTVQQPSSLCRSLQTWLESRTRNRRRDTRRTVASCDAEDGQGTPLGRAGGYMGAAVVVWGSVDRENRDKLELEWCRVMGGFAVHLVVRVQEQHAPG